MWLLLACAYDPAPDPDDDTSVEDSDTTEVITGEEPRGCDPGAADVYTSEGETVNIVIACRDVQAGGSIRPVALPEGATWEPSTRTVTWTPDIDEAGHYELIFEHVPEEGAVARASSGETDLWVADAWWAANNWPVNAETYEEEFGLPVVHLDVPDGINDADELPSSMWFRGDKYDVEVKLRGAASLSYPKNSYTLYFPPDGEFEDPETDYPKRRGVVLISTFDDNSYLRQKLCYDLWNALGDHAAEPRHRIETRFVVVYLDGRYEGLYVLADHIDGEYWEDQGYFEDGNLYKSVDHSANFYDSYGGAPKSTLASGYEKKEGTPEAGEPGAFADLEELVRFVVQSDDAAFEDDFPRRVAAQDFMDWWILVRFTEADDSGGKNAYLYHDPTAASPRWRYAPWDFNHALGQTWQTERESSSTDWDFTSANNIFNRLLTIPHTRDALVGRYRDMLAEPLSNPKLQALIDQHMAEIGPSAARDWARWETEYRAYGGWSWRTDWTTHDEEVAYVRQWVNERVVFMNGLYP